MLVLTGTGDRFMTDIDGPSLGDIIKPAAWDHTIAEGRRVMQRLVDLEMPIVAAVNCPGQPSLLSSPGAVPRQRPALRTVSPASFLSPRDPGAFGRAGPG